jgi:hypothetical protein
MVFSITSQKSQEPVKTLSKIENEEDYEFRGAP